MSLMLIPTERDPVQMMYTVGNWHVRSHVLLQLLPLKRRIFGLAVFMRLPLSEI